MDINLNIPFADPEILEITARRLKTEIVNEAVIPKNVGTLQTSHHVVMHPEEHRAEIATAEPYARRLYMHPEYNFSHAENRNAKGEWFEDWLQGGKHAARAAQIYAEEWAKKYGGG